MGTPIGQLAVRRSAWIDASPERIWEEFTTFDRMKTWFGTGHALAGYEPRLGGLVETDAGEHGDEELRFVGRVVAFDPARELSFEQDWVGHGWAVAPRITFRLTPYAPGGTIVELFHHGFEGNTATAGADLNGFEAGWDTHHLEALRQIVEAG